ncbi:MAG: glycerophosphodiester phosphodiesterase family protein, partial [Candidatus Poribacteria bacterium]|nr:glycerophosphodiester phosphodiesterase family protein [Candidatus Poribacteria bacterium]
MTRASRPIVVGHRGNAAEAPENTLAGFESAIALGVDMFEIDVQFTRDGKIVLVHNDTVDETTNGSGRVSDLTFEDVRRLDAGAHRGEAFRGQIVPTLREALDVARGRVMGN